MDEFRGIRLFVVLFTTTCTSFGWNAIGFLGPSRRSGNRPRIPSPSDSNLPRGVCKCESLYIASNSHRIWHFVNSRKKRPTRRRAPVSGNTKMENLYNDNARIRYSNVKRSWINHSSKVKRGRRKPSTILRLKKLHFWKINPNIVLLKISFSLLREK